MVGYMTRAAFTSPPNPHYISKMNVFTEFRKGYFAHQSTRPGTSVSTLIARSISGDAVIGLPPLALLMYRRANAGHAVR